MQANASGKHTGKRTPGHGNVGCCSIKTFTRTRAESVEFKSKTDHWKYATFGEGRGEQPPKGKPFYAARVKDLIKNYVLLGEVRLPAINGGK